MSSIVNAWGAETKSIPLADSGTYNSKSLDLDSTGCLSGCGYDGYFRLTPEEALKAALMLTEYAAHGFEERAKVCATASNTPPGGLKA